MRLKPVVASLVMLGLMAPAFAKSSAGQQASVIEQNSVNTPLCTDGWFNRITVGGLGSIVGVAGNHEPAGSYTHLSNSSDLYVNNFNLLVNANLSTWSKATLNLAYLGAPSMWNNMHTSADAKDFQWSYRQIKHTVVADEAYVTIANLNKYPFYVVFGKKYLPFGDYFDPYLPYQVMSPAQMLAQTNAVAAIVGVTSNFGFYGSLFVFKGETYPIDKSTGNIRNFGGKIGYYDHLTDFNVPNAHINVALSYIHNLWDSQVFSPNPEPQWSWNEKGTGSAVKVGHPVTVGSNTGEYAIDPVGGISAHADLAYKAFSMSVNFVSALKNMVTADYSVKHDSSRFWAADVNADYAFKTLDRDSHLGAGMQWTGNGTWFGNNKAKGGAGVITDWTRIIPKWRVVGEYKINLFKNTDLNLMVAHGRSYDFTTSADIGTDKEPKNDRTATVGLARLMIQL